ncbi:MAG: serine protease [Thermoleophilia bacterium]|nr:serine protease [Thermoleophilia bacterium]
MSPISLAASPVPVQPVTPPPTSGAPVVADASVIAAPAAPRVDESVGKVPEVPAPDNPGIAAGPTANVLIARMKVQADLTDEALLPRGPERKAAVYRDLVETARTSQADALAALEQLKASGDVTAVESLFLPNAILVTTKAGRHQSVADALAGVANVSQVAENKTWAVDADAGATGQTGELAPGHAGAIAGAAMLAYARGFVDGPKWLDVDNARRAELEVLGANQPTDDASVPTPVVDGEAPATAATPANGGRRDLAPEGSVEWGVAKINAPAAWAQGAAGAGVTVGIVDTGLDAAHPAIRDHYRGTNADGSQTHDYNWFDPFTRSAKPFDDGEHGTHVAGSTAGGTDERAIGVAPGAKIIAAKAINGAGYNTTSATLQALQFMLAPTKTDGTAPDPTKGADVINNSWGNANQADDTFMESFRALKAAGIEVVTAAGNDGPREGTVSPPGSYPGYLSVAASTERDSIASFSSRGPSKFATPEEMTPNVTAPGAGVTSSVPGGGYSRMSGTSMASPHVAGAVAVLLSKFPQATHDQIVSALTKTAVDIDRPGPDNAAGFGRIDVAKALEYLGGQQGMTPAT